MTDTERLDSLQSLSIHAPALVSNGGGLWAVIHEALILVADEDAEAMEDGKRVGATIDSYIPYQSWSESVRGAIDLYLASHLPK